ncbi:MAG: CHRD domain-containing protein [Planctomycetota bacterium]|jgi:hypothetical protein
MSIKQIAGGICLLLSLSLFAGCGGSSGGNGVAVTVIARLEAAPSGDKESTVIDRDAKATFVIEIRSDGKIDFAATAEAAWLAEITAMHIHRGAAGVDGGIEVDLLSGGISFNGITFTATGTLTIDPVLAEEIAANPAGFYVNIHTNRAPAGLVRDQLRVFVARQWHARLLGGNEVPPVETENRGAASFAVGADFSIDFVLAMATPTVTDVADAHIHPGGEGVNGGILVDLEIPTGSLDAAAGTVRGTVSGDVAALARILADPAGFYVNAHTAARPGGAARGQLAVGEVEMWAPLRGDEETNQVDPDARGGVTLEFETFASGRAILAVPPSQNIDAVNGAHVHFGAKNVDGGIAIDLLAGSDYTVSNPTGSAEGSIAYDQALFTRLLADPAGFYVNFHTAGAPAGLVRGQLTREAITFFAALDGTEIDPVEDPNASGAANVVVTGVQQCSFAITMTSPRAADLTAGGIHDGDAGIDGPTLIDLLGGSNWTLSGSSISGEVIFTGRTFARMMAAPELFYGNVATAGASGGIARGQAIRITGNTPPAGLSYDTPVVYVTGSPVGSNIPSSVGGAITNFGINPALPAGLDLDTATGVISGTPSVVSPATVYTVTASNAAGDTSAMVNITVNAAPPANLSYTTPVNYVTGAAITPNQPTSTGGPIDSYAITPTLPAGLNFNTSTGIISGTPTATSAAKDYTVTATNTAGDADATVNISVSASLQPPSGLSYASPVSYPTGAAITANAPSVGGGAVASWSISPALPAGLTFNTGTGVISGAPTTVTSAANYTVTASNAAGSTSATVNLTVPLGAPKSLSYSNTPNIGYVSGGFFATMSPTVSGGAVSSWSISPALSAGISLNTSTGVISGSPSALSSQTTYTVTATNATGNTSAQVVITVLP